MPIIKKLVGYVLGGPFFKPKVGGYWARSDITTMIWMTKENALNTCNKTLSWTTIYKITGDNIDVQETRLGSGVDKVCTTMQASKLKIEELVYSQEQHMR